jgi:hypothetical protein
VLLSSETITSSRLAVGIVAYVIPLFVEFGAPATGGPTELVKMTFSES